MTETERIADLEFIIKEQAEKIDTLINSNRLAKINFDLRRDIIQICEERDKALRKIEQLQNEINRLIG